MVSEPFTKNITGNPRFPVCLPNEWQAGLANACHCPWCLGVTDQSEIKNVYILLYITFMPVAL